jgi:hypothetical protein
MVPHVSHVLSAQEFVAVQSLPMILTTFEGCWFPNPPYENATILTMFRRSNEM